MRWWFRTGVIMRWWFRAWVIAGDEARPSVQPGRFLWVIVVGLGTPLMLATSCRTSGSRLGSSYYGDGY